MKSYVWDISTRLFHWLLVMLVCVSMYTGFVGGFEEMDWHMYSGYGILTLILFRIAWGFFGSRHARFVNFVRGPSAIIAYTQTLRTNPPSAGHSPLAALSVIALILSLLVQAVTGLFVTDDIFIEGPLVDRVSSDTSSLMTTIHDVNRWIIIALVVMHLAAIAFYRIVRGENLVLPMLTGWKQGIDMPPEQNRIWIALILFLMAAGGVYYLVEVV